MSQAEMKPRTIGQQETNMSLGHCLTPRSDRGPTSWFRRATRCRIGEIDVLVVSDGVLPLPTTDVGDTTPTRPPGRPG